MVELALVLSTISLLVAMVSLFGYSSLLKLIREQDQSSAAAERRYKDFVGPGLAVVLVTEDGCISCFERISEFGRLVTSLPEGLRPYIAHSGGVLNPDRLPEEVEVHRDPLIVGTLGVGMTPSLLVIDSEGKELARSVVGSDQALEEILDWAARSGSNRSEKEGSRN